MNLVDGATTFPVSVGNNASLARSEDTACCMETVSRADLAAVLARNLAITRGLRVVDALLLMLCVWEVQNFEWWEHSVAAEEVPDRKSTRLNSSHPVSSRMPSSA